MPLSELLLRALTKGPLCNPSPNPADLANDYFHVGGSSDSADRAREYMLNNQADLSEKRFPARLGARHDLVWIAGDIAWRTPRVVVVVAAVDSLENPAFTNDGYDWLTYETVLNKPKFRKTNQMRRIGLYAADVADMQFWVREDLPPESLNALCSAFLPDHQPAELAAMSKTSWWWKQKPDLQALIGRPAPYYEDLPALVPPAIDMPPIEPRSRANQVNARSIMRLHLPRRVVMPYNYWDNEEGSNALGTSPQAATETGGIKHEIALFQVAAESGDANSWQMWRTASRSCVMRLNRVKPAGAAWPHRNWQDWPFVEGRNNRTTFKYLEAALPRFQNAAFKAEVALGARYRLADKTADDFSVKTGVTFVGFEHQGNANKDVIGKDDEWLVGCMRSDTIRAMRQLATGHGAASENIVVQTEIMMILERRASPALRAYGVDGVALRDLTVLKRDHHYVPPLSLPFIAADMRTLTEEFALVGDATWCDFWQFHWAEALGAAKAWFLVQYGMQHANPNVQNYLLEFQTLPPGPGQQARVVIRDVADALLCREVAWALFGSDTPCPDGDIGAVIGELRTMRLPVLRFNFRDEHTAKGNETGSTDRQFGPSGIQFLWQRFTAFYGAQKPVKLVECPPARLPAVLRLLATWCFAHAASYVRTVENAIGFAFDGIAWDRFHDPDHHPDLFLAHPDRYEALAIRHMEWEETAAVALQSHFRRAGQAALCAYHNRGWTDATPAFKIILHNHLGQPLAGQVVYIEAKAGPSRAQRVTDRAGVIPFFAGVASDFNFFIGRGDYTGGVGAWARLKINLGAGTTVGMVTTLQTGEPFPQPPSVMVVAPGAALQGAAATLTATAEPDTGLSITGVQLSFDGNPLGAPVTAAPFSTTLDTTTVRNGTYNVTATATDSKGTSRTSPALPVTVANPLPTAAVAAPTPNAAIAGPTLACTVTATAGAGMTLAAVWCQIDGGVDLPTIVAGSMHSATLDVTALTAGAHHLVAKVRDSAGNEGVSAPVVFMKL